MRLIGHLKTEPNARTFADYLASQDILNQIERDAEGWAVWIHSEDQLEAGQKALADFEKNPGDARYQGVAEVAAAKERKREQEEQAFAKRVRTPDQIWSVSGKSPLTLVLIGICVYVAVMDKLDPVTWPDFHWFWFRQGGLGIMAQLQAGQVWRLISPIFIHFGAMHLIFNMLWMNDLGGAIERKEGTLKLALLVVLLGIGSNFGEYFWEGQPLATGFGGMSGVIYGLLGYVWIRGLCDPYFGLKLHPSTVAMMLVWFVLCLVHVIPDVANGAHGAGLILGMLWGFLPRVLRMFRS